MKLVLLLLTLAVIPARATSSVEFRYTVDLTRLSTDSFFVTLETRGLTQDSIVFQFTATAPGTYEVEDVGRFVGGFEAYDGAGQLLPVYRRSTNQYVIHNARQLAVLRYRVEDSYDTAIREDRVGPMSGSNLEADNALINGQMVFGYIQGYQSHPLQVRFNYPSDWQIGTALPKSGASYRADSYDHLVDSPVLFGHLTYRRLKLGKADVDIYAYSQNGIVTADSLLDHLKDMLKAADRFLDGLPVDRFVFLFHFRKDFGPSFGALEHKYSSYFYMPEQPMSKMQRLLVSFAAHEFFHIVTPLNIHSEIIDVYNFVTPTPSRHLWLYEGCTEWAAHMMQVKGGLTTPDQYLATITQKLTLNDRFNPNVSLLDLSLGSYGHLADQYQNIYYKGALVAMLLDMRLLELSKGKRGLRDVIKELSKKYGPRRSFTDSTFFDEFVAMTYPEIDDIFNRYVKGSEPLPIADYLSRAGYRYHASIATGEYRARGPKAAFEGAVDGSFVVSSVDTSDTVSRELKIQVGDTLVKVATQGIEIDAHSPEIGTFTKRLVTGEPFSMTVRRADGEVTLTAAAGRQEIINKHVIEEIESPTKEQMEFRKRWLQSK